MGAIIKYTKDSHISNCRFIVYLTRKNQFTLAIYSLTLIHLRLTASTPEYSSLYF